MTTYPYRLQKPFKLLMIALLIIGLGILLGYIALYDPSPLNIRFFRLLTLDLTEIQMVWFVGTLSALCFTVVAALFMSALMIHRKKPAVILQKDSMIVPKGFAGMKTIEVAYDDIQECAFTQTPHALFLKVVFVTGKFSLSSQHFSEETLEKIAQHIISHN